MNVIDTFDKYINDPGYEESSAICLQIGLSYLMGYGYLDIIEADSGIIHFEDKDCLGFYED